MISSGWCEIDEQLKARKWRMRMGWVCEKCEEVTS